MPTVQCDEEFCKNWKYGYCTANMIILNFNYNVGEICENYEEIGNEEN